MNAREAFQAAQLKSAIDLAIESVRANPSDRGKRTFLFELLVFAGELDRAAKQLEAIAPSDPEEAVALDVYRCCLASERARQAVFFAGGLPEFRVEPPAYAAHHIRVLERLRKQDAAGAAAALEEARGAWPSLHGTAKGAKVEEFRDLDDVLAPFLEVFDRGAYVWIPLERVRRVTARAPKFPRDLVWRPAEIELHDGNVGQIFLPTIYPWTIKHPSTNDALKLGRATEWVEAAPNITIGLGLRMYLCGESDASAVELSDLVLDAPKPN